MIQSIRNSTISTKIGIAFSGGVDSTLLAKICANMNYEITLLTIGFEGSHDIEFSKKKAAMLGFVHHDKIISDKS